MLIFLYLGLDFCFHKTIICIIHILDLRSLIACKDIESFLNHQIFRLVFLFFAQNSITFQK